MALIVQKFGGSSVKDRDRIFNVARIVANTHNAGNDVVVVVSAQGDTTDDLIAKAGEITHNPSAREMDVLLASGEQISISLLAMALNELGCHAISLTGWQAGFRTDRAYTKARITRLETERISSELERNRVVVVAGFQGLNKMDDITTLGRGGSDTSAVAIAAALHADRCQIFTDVEGVYTADPRKVRNTRKLDEITFDEMLELASLGAQVLNNRSAAPTPALLPLQQPCTQTAARSLPMWKAFTRPTRARCATPASWMRSPLTRCWSWHLWVHRC